MEEGGETDGGDDTVTYNSVGVLATNGHELTSSCMGRPSTVQRIDQNNTARQYSAKGSTKWLQSVGHNKSIVCLKNGPMATQLDCVITVLGPNSKSKNNIDTQSVTYPNFSFPHFAFTFTYPNSVIWTPSDPQHVQISSFLLYSLWQKMVQTMAEKKNLAFRICAF